MKTYEMVIFLCGICCLLCSCSTIDIVSDPSGARVLMNGKETGQVTPAHFKVRSLRRGQYAIAVEKDGYAMTSPPQNIVVRIALGKVVFGFFPLFFPKFVIADKWKSSHDPRPFILEPVDTRDRLRPRVDNRDHPHRGRTAAVLAFDARGGLSADEIALLTDRFSVELGRTEVYRLVSQSKIREVLTLQNLSTSCNSVECAVEAGQLLGVEFIIYGSIGSIGSLYTINVYLTSVEKGDIVASETVDHRGDIESLLTDGMALAADKLLKKTQGVQP